MELIIITIAYVLGIIWGLYLNISIAFLLPCLILLYFVIKKDLKKYLVLFIVAIVISNIQISIKETKFDEEYFLLQGRNEIIGTVISNPIYKEYKTEYIVNVEKINNSAEYKNMKLILYVKNIQSDLEYGDKILFCGELENAKTTRNEGGFNYREYLKIKGISKIVTIYNKEIKIIKKNDVNFFYMFINSVKNKIIVISNNMLPENESSLLIGILIGDKTNLDEEIKENFKNSSLSHILAVSGMHVSYVIMGVSFIINKIKIGKTKMKMIMIIILIFFMLLTGSSPSVQRACIMSIYLTVGSLLRKRCNVLNSIAFSMLSILIANPYNICDIGLILSFGGTIGIVLIYPLFDKNIKKDNLTLLKKIKIKIIEIVLITISANLMIFPIILYNFNTLSTVFLISNLLVSPIIGIIILFGFLLIFISFLFNPLGKILSPFLKFFLDILLNISKSLSSISFSQIFIATPKLYQIIIYYLLIIFYIIIKYKKINFKNLKILISVILVFLIVFNCVFNFLTPKCLKIYFIDVGQRR